MNLPMSHSSDPVRTRQGQLTLRAFRLSKKALELGINNDWSPEMLSFYA